MAYIDLVIRIPEETYQHYKKVWQKRRGSIPESCIAFGIPLPKGHGRLIDADAYGNSLKLAIPNPINNEELNGFMKGLCKAKLELIDAPTIIEADKSESEK